MDSRILAAAFGLLALGGGGCAPVDDAAGPDDLDQSTEEVQWNITNKQQNDGSVCQWDNCGPTSAAMMRYAMTHGSENHSGGAMRTYLQRYYGESSQTCGGTNLSDLSGLMEHISSYDGGPNYSASTTHLSSATLSTLEDYLSPSHGYVAVIAGGGTGHHAAPCGFTGSHSIYVERYDPNGDRFLVYDPCCSSACAGSHYNGTHSPQWWPASSFNSFRWSGALIGRGSQAACLSGTTQTCTGGSAGCPCTCGTATRTCTSAQAWGAWSACATGC